MNPHSMFLYHDASYKAAASSSHPRTTCHHLYAEQYDPQPLLLQAGLPSCIQHKRCSPVLQGTWLSPSATCFRNHACLSSSGPHDAWRHVHCNSAVHMEPHVGTLDGHMVPVLCLAFASHSLLLCTGCGERIKPAPTPKKPKKKARWNISSRPSTILCSLIISQLFWKNITDFLKTLSQELPSAIAISAIPNLHHPFLHQASNMEFPLWPVS